VENVLRCQAVDAARPNVPSRVHQRNELSLNVPVRSYDNSSHLYHAIMAKREQPCGFNVDHGYGPWDQGQ